MTTYYVRGVSGGIATAGADETWAELWNPHASRRIRVVECGLFLMDFAGLGQPYWYLARSTTKGTAASTVTPDADNSAEGDVTPPSGATLELAEFSAQPTLATPPLYSFPASLLTPSNGGGFIIPMPRGFWLPPSQGLCIVYKLNETFSGGCEVNFTFED